MEKEFNIKKIETEDEYWKQHKIYKRKVGKLTRNIKVLVMKPDEYIKQFEELMNEMVYIELISLEYANKKRRQLYDELNKPSEFKEWVTKKLKRFKKEKTN